MASGSTRVMALGDVKGLEGKCEGGDAVSCPLRLSVLLLNNVLSVLASPQLLSIVWDLWCYAVAVRCS